MEVSEEQNLVNRLKEKSQGWAREFLRSIPDGTLEDSIEWLRGLVNRTVDEATKELASIFIKAHVGPESGLISVPFPGATSKAGVWSGASFPEYPSAIWEVALKEASGYIATRQKPVRVRGLDPDLYTKARAQAIRENRNLAEWINEAIREKLEIKKQAK